MQGLLLVVALFSLAAGWGNVAHYDGQTVIGGNYMVTDAALKLYNDVSADNFGTTTVDLPGDLKPVVRDMQYPVGDGVGYVPTPCSDGGSNAVMDELLREEMGLSANDQIFAMIAYLHPQRHTGNVKDLATTLLKTEGGMSHLGMYIGNGATRNSPEGYHNKGWQVAGSASSHGYPATLQLISLEGVAQEKFNRNAYIGMALLNKGVQFPGDYKQDIYRTIDLKTTLRFYADWLKDEAYLKSDNTWKTYCAEHVTIVVNVALNVPQNEAMYKRIWGDAEGAKLWKIARDKFTVIVGEAEAARIWGAGIEFEALWQRRNVADPKNEGTFAKALAWPAQTNSDIMVNFLQMYASWPTVGAHVSSSVAFGFKDTLVGRMANTEAGIAHIGKKFDELVFKTAVLSFVAEALTVRPINAATYFAEKRMYMFKALGGETPGDADPRWKLAGAIMGACAPFHPQLVTGTKVSKEDAYKWFSKEVQPIVQYGREVSILETEAANDGETRLIDGLVRFNSPPAVSHRVAIGQHKGDPAVTIREVATALDGGEIREKTAEEKARNARLAGGARRENVSETNFAAMSYRQLQLACMEAELNPCNGRKAVLLRKVQASAPRSMRR